MPRPSSNFNVRYIAAGCIWAIAVVAFVLSLAGASSGVVFSLLGAAGALCTYLLLVVFEADEDGAGARVSWARTFWERVSSEPMPARLENEEDGEYSARIFTLAQESARQAQTEPHRSTDFRRALDGMDLPVLAFDEQGMAILANHAASQYFGVSEEQIRVRSVEELLPQREAFELVQRAVKGAGGKCSIRVEQRIIEVVAAGVQGERSDGRFAAVVTLRDITELAQASQLKTDFVASASHEIRTPLASIKAAAETLRDGAAEVPALRERFLTMIQNNTERLEELTRDLMDLSRLETPEVEVERRAMNIESEVDSIRLTLASALAERKMSLATDFGGIRQLHTDPKLLRLILQNLIDNAAKYGNAESTIKLTVKAIDLEKEKPDVRITVSDSGIGIPLAAQTRIFERFYQVDFSRSGQQHRRGTGLGLAIVKHAVKSLGGTISVESVWQQGTTMTIDLPDSVGEMAQE